METQQPVRIALVGRRLVNRTMCAEYLRVHHKFHRMDLIDPVGKFLKKLYFYNRDQRLPWETKRSYYDSLYKLDPDLLVNYLAERVKLSPSRIIVSDVRYMSEAKLLREMDFKIVRVTAPNTKELHVSKALGKTAAPGTLLLNEMYNKDFTKELRVDYSVHNAEREATKRALDDIMADILTKQI